MRIRLGHREDLTSGSECKEEGVPWPLDRHPVRPGQRRRCGEGSPGLAALGAGSGGVVSRDMSVRLVRCSLVEAHPEKGVMAGGQAGHMEQEHHKYC